MGSACKKRGCLLEGECLEIELLRYAFSRLLARDNRDSGLSEKCFKKKFSWVFCVSDLEGLGQGLFDFGSFIFLLSFIFIFHLYKDS